MRLDSDSSPPISDLLFTFLGSNADCPTISGPWGRQREPLQEEDLVPAVGPAGPGSGAACPRGRPGQSSGPPGAVLQHPAALQRRPRPARAHRGSGCGSADPRLLPQRHCCWNLMVQLRVLIPPGAFGGNDVDAPRHSNKSKFGLFLQVFELQEAKCVC